MVTCTDFTTGYNPVLYRIHPGTAQATLIGSLGVDYVFEGGLAFSPTGQAYGTNLLVSGTSAGLFGLDLTTGRATAVGRIGNGLYDVNGLTWRSDGMLVGLDRMTNALLQINPTTAVSSVIAGISPAVGAVGGMAVLDGVGFFSTSAVIGAHPGSNSLYSFDLFTGSYQLIGAWPGDLGTGISGLAAPEPATLSLLALGGLLLARRRRA